MMQNLVDSLCQCFGAAVPQKGGGRADTSLESMCAQDTTAGRVSEIKQRDPSTPESHKRRTRSLVKNKKWDGLFTDDEQPVSKHHKRGVSMDQAQAIAKAKLVAATSSKKNYKRRRTSSRDDIFRSKQGPAANSNPFSRFLSNNPAIVNALCFANPIRDSADLCDAGSVVSDSNTLNTAEDTITSTLYYEKTKLAGLKQKNPPVPLFNCFAVEPKDDIHQIVLTHSHSSVKLLDMYGGKKQSQQPIVEEVDIESTPPSTPGRPPFRGAEGSDGTPPPPIANVSSDSSSSHNRGQ